MCIGVYIFMLILKSRIIGGGLECGTIVNRCFSKNADQSEGSLGAVSSDTQIMKSHIVNSYENVLMIKYLKDFTEGQDKDDFVRVSTSQKRLNY